MIHYIKGELTLRSAEGLIVVETGGIGYEIHIPANTTLDAARPGETVTVRTTVVMKEDDIRLYGFPDGETQTLFGRLLTVAGVGAKAAMALLSAMPAQELVKAVLFGDVARLTKANGVGKKSAERIILELKDKLALPTATGVADAFDPVLRDARAEATEALIGLGYSRSEAAPAVLAVREEGLTAEAYIKAALRKL